MPIRARKLHVVLVTETLGEHAGGITSAVCELADALYSAGLKVAVFALYDGEKYGKIRAPQNHEITTSVPQPKSSFLGMPALALRSALIEYCNNNRVDIIHVNGLWLPSTLVAVAIAKVKKIPVVLSLHGFLQPWAIKHRRWKKKLAWWLYAKRCIGQAKLLQAASERERLAYRTLGITNPVSIVPNIIAIPDTFPLVDRGYKRLKKLLFLSRVHPSKGILDLLKAWKKVRPRGWKLVIAGPDENDHLKTVVRYIDRHRLTSEVDIVGPIRYRDRWKMYRSADVFVLPTYSENFGVTVAEAMASGLPVITTSAAPWEILSEFNCGWWVEPNVASLADALRQATSIGDEERREMGAIGQSYIEKNFTPNAVSGLMIESYEWVVYGLSCPSCITLE